MTGSDDVTDGIGATPVNGARNGSGPLVPDAVAAPDSADVGTDAEIATLGQLGQKVVGKVGEMTDVAAADRVYAPPVEAHGHIVIPAAVVKWSGGFGFGMARGQQTPDPNGGGGGGGGGEGRPIAVIDVSADGVSIKPVWDFTKLGLTVVTAALTIWRAASKKR